MFDGGLNLPLNLQCDLDSVDRKLTRYHCASPPEDAGKVMFGSI